MSESSIELVVFDLKALAAKFPPTADTMLLDMRLTDEPAASSRLFRIYKPAPAHYHKTCDEYLQVICRTGEVCGGRERTGRTGAGAAAVFPTQHGSCDSGDLEEPLVVFSVDTPRRDPSDVTFVDPQYGTAKEFIRTIPAY